MFRFVDQSAVRAYLARNHRGEMSWIDVLQVFSLVALGYSLKGRGSLLAGLQEMSLLAALPLAGGLVLLFMNPWNRAASGDSSARGRVTTALWCIVGFVAAVFILAPALRLASSWDGLIGPFLREQLSVVGLTPIDGTQLLLALSAALAVWLIIHGWLARKGSTVYFQVMMSTGDFPEEDFATYPLVVTVVARWIRARWSDRRAESFTCRQRREAERAEEARMRQTEQDEAMDALLGSDETEPAGFEQSVSQGSGASFVPAS